MRLIYAFEMRLVRGEDGAIRCPTGQYAYDSGRYAELLEAFDEVQVLARVADGGEARGGPVHGPGVTVFPLPALRGPGGIARGVPSLLTAARRASRGADVAFCRVPGVVGGTLAKACWLRGVPLALQVVGDPEQVLAGHPDAGSLIPRFLAADQRWLCQHADRVTYVTGASLQRAYPPGPHTEATHFSDIDLGPEAYVDAPRRWEGGSLTLVAVGKLEQHYKGIDVLVRAVAALHGRLDVRVRVVGDGRQRPGYEALARKLGVDDRVAFVGSVSSGQAVRDELDRGDLFAMPSRTEGLPRALLEAMARGLPAVATDVGGIPELLDPEVMVGVDDVEAFAAKIAWLADPERLAAQSERNLAVAREYAREVLEPKRRAWIRALGELAR